MHGPPLSPSEMAAYLACGVERLEALGVPHGHASRAKAVVPS